MLYFMRGIANRKQEVQSRIYLVRKKTPSIILHFHLKYGLECCYVHIQ